MDICALVYVFMGLLDYPERNFRCPACGHKMRTEEYRAFSPWVCRRCGEQLQFSRAYGAIQTWGTLLLSLAICYLFRLSGWEFVLIAVIIWPVLLFLSNSVHRVVPPRLERYRPLGSGLGSHSPRTLFSNTSPTTPLANESRETKQESENTSSK
jgi:hypothetical protein